MGNICLLRKTQQNLKFKNYILFGDKNEDLSLQHSILENLRDCSKEEEGKAGFTGVFAIKTMYRISKEKLLVKESQISQGI